LPAIFAGDIAGYSRLMGVDEEGTLPRFYSFPAVRWRKPGRLPPDRRCSRPRCHERKRPIKQPVSISGCSIN